MSLQGAEAVQLPETPGSPSLTLPKAPSALQG